MKLLGEMKLLGDMKMLREMKMLGDFCKARHVFCGRGGRKKRLKLVEETLFSNKFKLK